MGSFAYSFHVRSDNAEQVVTAISDYLTEEGYRPTDEEPSDEEASGFGGARRGVWVAESTGGWVGVLDSDMMGASVLAMTLSQRLGTTSMNVYVNDSDSWGYVLCRAGEVLDEFDSDGELADELFDGQLPPELIDLANSGDFEAIREQLQQQAQQMEQAMEAATPPEIRDLQKKMEAGTITSDEAARYNQWASTALPEVLNVVGPDMETFLDSSPEPHDEDSLLRCADALRFLLPSAVSNERVAAVLAKRVTFAEEVLAEFLALLGVDDFFATTSYRYLLDDLNNDVSQSPVAFVEHLKFTTSDGPSLSVFSPE